MGLSQSETNRNADTFITELLNKLDAQNARIANLEASEGPATFVLPNMTLWVGVSSTASLGDFNTVQLGGGAGTRLNFMIPENFNTLISAEYLIGVPTSQTLGWTIDTDYFNPDNSENYNNHSAQVVGSTALTVDKPQWVSFSSALASLAAGDVIGTLFTVTSTVNHGKVFGLRIIYTIA